jgi:hypothetical protein
MTTKSRKKSAGSGGNKQQAQTQPTKAKKPAFVSRYIGIDSHFTERNGSTEQVFGIAAERPAGRKLADDITNMCNQLDAEGYDIIAIFPLTSGRTAEVSAEAAVAIPGLTYSYGSNEEPQSDKSMMFGTDDREHYVDTGVGYSVTDGVIITAKWRG